MDEFARRLLAWFDQHGRHDLPWQQNPTPYRVWISEIMLQQTQVATVIPYYHRFMQAFPTLTALAEADHDAVMAHWAGLGYYSRARHLHRAAQQVCAQHAGQLPEQLDALMALPGIGRSTAGAILSIACAQATPILDGNVKRVLCRYHAIDGWPGQREVEQRLWQYAISHTPQQRNAAYTQAIMDLGATLCRRSRPQCTQCPLQADCQARQQQRSHALPTQRPRKALPERHTTMLLLQNARGELLLQRRPPSGIWGGLWSLPECPTEQPAQHWCHTQLGLEPASLQAHPSLLHTFSHYRLHIHPMSGQIQDGAGQIMEPSAALWYNTESITQLGLPAPVKTLVEQIVLNKEPTL